MTSSASAQRQTSSSEAREMTQSPSDGLITASPPSLLQSIITPAPQTLANSNSNNAANIVEPVPTVPPPAYVPPSECRTSRLYGVDDFVANNPTAADHDNDPERAAPPPPYMPPQRQQTIMLFASRRPHGSQGSDAEFQPTVNSYVKTARRRKCYATVIFTAALVIGIIVLVNFFYRNRSD